MSVTKDKRAERGAERGAETPTPVVITDVDEPVPVFLSKGAEALSTVTKGEGTTLSPTTTEEGDRVTAGQRHINLIWENTQSRIALMVVAVGIAVNSLVVVFVVFFNKEVSVTQLALVTIPLQFINLTTGMVIGFYFSRTNHSAQGGIGPKPDGPYLGR